jgi:hypothetical protein
MNIYKGEFTSIIGNNYRVLIYANYDESLDVVGKEVSLTMGGTPFTTEMDTEGDNMYRVRKCTAASINVITPDYLFDIYTAKAQGTKVVLQKENTNGVYKTIWSGYVEPMLYDQGFVEEREEIEISALDSLSTLQYIKYTPMGEKCSVKPLNKLIGHILRQCDTKHQSEDNLPYKRFFFPKTITIDGCTSPTCQAIHLNERNFFDNMDSENEYDLSDDDAYQNALHDSAKTCQEVLDSICLYLGYTCVPYHEDIYFLDYDGLVHGKKTYECYDVLTGSYQGDMTVSGEYLIEGSSYADTGASISLDEVYSDITVTTSSNEIEEIVPEIDNRLINITSDSAKLYTPESGLSSSNNDARFGVMGEIINNSKYTSIYYTGDLINHNTLVFFMKSYGGDHGDINKEYPHHYFVATRYLQNQNYKFYQYDKNLNDITDQITSISYADTKSMLGATQCKMMYKYLDNQEGQDVLDKWKQGGIGNSAALNKILQYNNITDISFNDYIILRLPKSLYDVYKAKKENTLPFFETTFDNNITFGGKDNYLIISGSWLHHYIDDVNNVNVQVVPIDKVKDVKGDDEAYSYDIYVLCKLQFGDKYWNGVRWVSSETTFKLYIDTGGEWDSYKDVGDGAGNRNVYLTKKKDMPFKWHKFNNVGMSDWRNNVSEDGYAIPVSNLMVGEIKFTMYRPHFWDYKDTTESDRKSINPYIVFIKDFKIEPYIADTTYSDIIDTETEYSATIDENVVQEFSDIELDVFTNDGKTPSYSIAMYKDDNDQYQYLDEVGYTSIKDLLHENGLDEKQRLENHLVMKLANQYSSPAKKLELTLKDIHNLPYRIYEDNYLNETCEDTNRFIIDTASIDYKMNCSTLQLIEKK